MEKRIIALAGASLCAAMMATSAHANILLPGLYTLNNHPDGNQDPPPYGMRLDGIDGNPNSIVSFDFNAPGAAMFLDFDGTNIHIYGTAFGGVDTGNEYDPNESGFVEIDFTYTNVVKSPGDDDLVNSNPDGVDSGTITLWDGSFHTLQSYHGGHPFSFRLGDEDDDLGHRGFDGISGWGWLNYDNAPHNVASDWLFTVKPIPAPSALAVLALGVGFKRRRRQG